MRTFFIFIFSFLLGMFVSGFLMRGSAQVSDVPDDKGVYPIIYYLRSLKVYDDIQGKEYYWINGKKDFSVSSQVSQ